MMFLALEVFFGHLTPKTLFYLALHAEEQMPNKYLLKLFFNTFCLDTLEAVLGCSMAFAQLFWIASLEHS